MPAPAIQSSNIRYQYGLAYLPQFKATGATGNIQWSAPYGSFSPTTTTNGQKTTYTPANQSDQVIVTAKDTADNATSQTQIDIDGTTPDRGQWGGLSRKLDDRTVASFAADRSADFGPRTPAFQNMAHTLPGRNAAEYAAMKAFAAWHRTFRFFFIEDPHLDGVFYKVKFKELPDETHQGPDDVDYTVTYVERNLVAFQPAQTPPNPL